MHEVGHIVDYDRISDSEMQTFARYFRASPHWRQCFEHAGSCLTTDEIFADQFAMYATSEPQSMTTYGVPRLVSTVMFERLLTQATDDKSAIYHAAETLAASS